MTATIHPTAIVDPAAHVGANAKIGPYCIVGPNVSIGEGTELLSMVSVQGHTTIGRNNVIHHGAALGHPPQDLKYKGGPTTLTIGDNNTIREHATMHIGTETGRGKTTVGSGGLFMVCSHVGHDCAVGDGVIMANSAALGGHTVVGDKVILGGLVGVHQFTRIGAHAFVGGGGVVTGDVIPYGMVDNHGRLAGLNLVGLKRRGFSREVINDLRPAYRLLFAAEGAFQERMADAARLFAERPEVQEIIAFLRADSPRPLCLPDDR